MSVKRFVVTIASLFLIASTVFAPLPWNIALNHETKQCAGYWGGDEFVMYELPDGWETFEFQYSETFISAETDIGTCKVVRDEINVSLEEACCSQLGYTFVAENIGIRRITSANLTSQAVFEEASLPELEKRRDQAFYVFFITSIVLLVILVTRLIYRSRKR